jgi:hypothetical protein
MLHEKMNSSAHPDIHQAALSQMNMKISPFIGKQITKHSAAIHQIKLRNLASKNTHLSVAVEALV